MLSWVLPCRNEYPQIMWSIYSIIDSIPEYEPFEIIIVENGCNEETLKFLDYFFEDTNGSKPAKLARLGLVRVIHNDVLGGAPALHRGAEEAKGDVVAWTCAHVHVWDDTVKKMLNLCRKTDGEMIHAPMLWMGDFTTAKEGYKRKCYQYWNPLTRGWNWVRFRDTPYTICSGGGGLSMFGKDKWKRIGGFNPNLNVYGGGEIYLDNKWWLLGGKIYMCPDALYYHWAYSRGFKWTMGSVHWNKMVAHYCIGGDKLVQMMHKDQLKHESYQKMYAEVKEKCQDDYERIQRDMKYDSVFDMWQKEPWDFPKRQWLRDTGNTVGLQSWINLGLDKV